MDAVLKGVSTLANYPANLLFRHRSPKAAILHELQRIPRDSLIGLAEHKQTIVGIGDPGQRVVSVGAWRSEGLATQRLDRDEGEEPQPSSS